MATIDSNFWSIFTPGPILDNVGKYLAIGDIIHLSRTCTGLSGLYKELRSRQWDVDTMLKRFFDRPKAFRRQIGHAEALITGSFALEFFERGAWNASDLDIVVVEGMNAIMLSNHLILSEGYTHDIESNPAPAYFFKHVIQIESFSNPRRGNQHVHLYILSDISFPIRSILEGFWTTSVINFLSWKMAYSIFPSPTFLHHKCYLLQRPSQERDFPIQKYSDRGWNFNLSIPVPPDDRQGRIALQRTRKITDRLSWKIPLNTQGMDVPDSLDPVRPDSDDHVAISEIITGIDQETLERFEAAGAACKLSGNFVTHYNIRYMKYCGFLY